MGGAVENIEKTIWGIVKSVCVIALTVVACIKIYQTPIDLKVDFPTLLSLLLALFSVGLAALFYFKATDTSNTFYDNTYKFTKDIAQLLTKIESGFGERLRHLDEGYASMRTSLENKSSSTPSEAVAETMQKLKEEKDEHKKVLEQRNKIVSELLRRSQLQEGEKEKIATELQRKESELSDTQKKMSHLNRQLLVERVRRRRGMEDEDGSRSGMDIFTRAQVIEKIGANTILGLSRSELSHKFRDLLDELPKRYILDLTEHGYVRHGLLTPTGAEYFHRLASADL
jgi:hypothetical protein